MDRITSILLAALAAGCASTTGAASEDRAKPRPLGQELETPLAGPLAPLLPEDGATAAGPLTLAEAHRLALRHNPVLAARGAQVRAREGELRQAGALPNPELEVSAEDFVVGDAGADAGPMQISATLTQPIELGGKRGARMEAAGHRRNEAEWAFEAERLGLYRDTTHAFVELLAAQRRHANAEEMVALAEQTVGVLEAKVEAGKATPLEVKRTRVTLALARIEQNETARSQETARSALAAFWGEAQPRFLEAQGGFAIPFELPTLADLRPRLAEHPEAQRQAALLAEQRAQLALEESLAVPDLSIGVGYRWLNQDQQSALLAAVALPLPVFDLHQGQIDAATHEIVRAEREADAAQLRLLGQLERTLGVLRAAHYEVQTLSGEVLVEATESHRAVVAGYELGRFGYLELIDAQRTLFEAVHRSVEARAAFFTAAADLEALVGEPLFDWTPGREQLTPDLGWRRGLTSEPALALPPTSSPDSEPPTEPQPTTEPTPDPQPSAEPTP